MVPYIETIHIDLQRAAVKSWAGVSRRAPSRLFVLALCVYAALVGARALLGVSHGLRAEYFSTEQRIGTPTLTTVDAEVSTAQLTHDWLDQPPPRFSIRWFGYLVISRAGLYTLALRSDDGSTLSIDGRVIVDNSGLHPALTRSARVQLDAGSHAVLIEYFQAGGSYEIEWQWAADGGPLAPVPSWALSPKRIEPWKAILARLLDWSCEVAGALVVALAIWCALRDGGRRFLQQVRAHPRIATLALFAGLTVAETWPLAAHPARLSRNDNGDTILNEWILAWVAHEGPRAPLHLYDANIFYPERDTLAYSESLIVQSAMGAPLGWLGASPVLTYNLVLLTGFVLTGWTMCLVMARWTGEWMAGVAAGIVLAFNAYTLTRLPHIQAQHAEFLPLALLALDALLGKPRVGHAIRLAGWFALQALTSMYLLVFSAVALTVAALVRPESWFGPRFQKVASHIALAAFLAALLLLPFVLPYWRAYHDQGLSRSLEDATGFAASWRDYLSTPGRWHYAWWSHAWFTGTPLFPGVLALVLAGVAVARGTAWADPRARMYLAIGVAGAALSFGTYLPGYAALYRAVPLLHAIRVVSRFGCLAVFAVAALAGFGWVEVRRDIQRNASRAWTPVAAILLVLMALEPYAAPLDLSRFDGIPPIYAQLRSVPQAVVVEIPLYDPRAAFANATYMLNSTANWKPLVNGYSGFQPLSYYKHFEVLSRFPEPDSIAALQALGVTHLFVHLDVLGRGIVEKLARIPALRRVASEGPIVLYQVVEH